MGHHLDKVWLSRNIVPHKVYSDVVVPNNASDNTLIYRLSADLGKSFQSLSITTEIQSSEEMGPYLAVSVSNTPDGQWLPVYIQRVGKANAFECRYETIKHIDAPVYYLKISFGNCWTNGGGQANINLRRVHVDAEEIAGDFPELMFKDRFNVFTAGENVVIYGLPSGSKRTYEVMDHLKRSVTKIDFDPAGQETLNLGKLSPGFYHIFRAAQERARFCVVAKNIQARSAKSLAQMDLGRNGSWPIETTKKVSKLCQLAGVQYIRERWGYGWASMEPEKGKFNLQPMMDFLEIEKQYGLKVTLVLMGLPSWAGREYGDDLRDTFTSAKEISERMKNVTCSWEYWNEEDSWPFGQGPAHRYASAMKAAYLGFRGTDTDGSFFKVATGGISAIARAKFIDDMLANKIGPYFDVYNSHIYEPISNFASVYQQHDRLLNSHGLGDKEKWITEGGAEIHIDLGKIKTKWQAECEVPQVDLNTATCDILPIESREEVTARLIKSWVYSARYHWSRFFTFCFAYYNEGVKIWGMLAPGLTATSSYAGLATYNNWLGDLEYAGKISLPGNLEGHLYRGQGRQVAVLWSTGQKQTLNLSRGQTVYFMTGEKMTSAPGTVEIDSNPVFMVMDSFEGRLDTISHPLIQPEVKPSASRIVLDFVRTPKDTKWKVNDQRTFILESLKQKVTGDLCVYNFDSKEWRGDLHIKAPSDWQVSLDKTSVQIPAMGRVLLKMTITAGANYQNEIQRIYVQADNDRAYVAISFLYDKVLGARAVSSLISDKVQFVPDEPTQAVMKQVDGKLVIKIDFAGKTPTIRLRAPLHNITADGIIFTILRHPEKGQPCYIDVRVTNRDGSVSRLLPNIFPVFLEGVLSESHVISFSELTPATDSGKAVQVEISFSAFDPGPVEFDISEWKVSIKK
jgi:hypothetical protein